jgi:dihydroflavonol-4-reductase
MKIFLTGATGFIGSHVARRLAQSKHELRCLVRKTSEVAALREIGATLVPGDVTDKNSILKGMSGCDSVINIAGLFSFWEPERRVFAATNVEGVRNVMEAALESGVSKVVHVSTVATYGKPGDNPFTEESMLGPVRFSDYSRTKYEGDLIAWELYRNKKLPLVMIYPAGVLGPDDPKASGKYINDFINHRLPARVLEDCVLTWVHVRDVAEAIVRALEKTNNIGERYFVGKERLTFREVNQMISEISGVRAPRLLLPDLLVSLNAVLLTWVANVIKKPPPWGMSVDQIRVMKEGFRVDGRKVEKELCLEYTPVRVALSEAIASYRAWRRS